MVHQKSNKVTPRQVELLTVLSRSRSCFIGEIASTFGVSYVAASKMINRLEGKGLVTRSKDEWDRRRTEVRLTHSGTEVVRLFGSLTDKGGS